MFDGNLAALAGGSALIGVIYAMWGNLRAMWSQAVSRVFLTVELEDHMSEAILLYLKDNFSRSQLGNRAFAGWKLFLRRLRRRCLVGLEITGSSGVIYWQGWRWIYLSHQGDTGAEAQQYRASLHCREVQLTYFRWFFDCDALVAAAVDHYNATYLAGGGERRHRIAHHFGTDGKPAQLSQASVSEPRRGDWGVEDCMPYRLIDCTLDDIGSEPLPGRALERLALSPEAEDVRRDVERWMASETWYAERGLPWKRGYLLYGPPGNGKTAFIRALTQDLDLPVPVFDLATLFNDELRAAWSEMMQSTPCAAVIEDVDAVFHGRDNAKGHLTFDCLLNCLDGVATTHGLLTLVTTNHPERLDPALGGAGMGVVGDPERPLVAPRPGRIDRAVHMGPPDEAGRLRLARRIVPDAPEAWAQLAADGAGDTGAQYQERCRLVALDRYWTPQDPTHTRDAVMAG